MLVNVASSNNAKGMTEVANWKCGLLITDCLVPEVNIKYIVCIEKTYL